MNTLWRFEESEEDREEEGEDDSDHRAFLKFLFTFVNIY